MKPVVPGNNFFWFTEGLPTLTQDVPNGALAFEMTRTAVYQYSLSGGWASFAGSGLPIPTTEAQRAATFDILVPSGATFGSAFEKYIVPSRVNGVGNGTKTNPLPAPTKSAVDAIMNVSDGMVHHWGAGEYEASGWQPNTVGNSKEWVRDNTHHVGMGRETQFKLMGNPGAGGYIEAKLFGHTYEKVVNNFGIHDLLIDCNASAILSPGVINQAAAIGISGGNNVHVKNVEVINWGTLAGECFVVSCLAGLDVPFFPQNHYGMLFSNIRFENIYCHSPMLSGNLDGSTILGIVGLESYPVKTSGALIVGKTYQIMKYVSSDSFTNVGAASNATGVRFTASGTTPTTWSNASVLAQLTNVQLCNAVIRDCVTGDMSTADFPYLQGPSAPLVEGCDVGPCTTGSYVEITSSLNIRPLTFRRNTYRIKTGNGLFVRLGGPGLLQKLDVSDNDFIFYTNAGARGLIVNTEPGALARIHTLTAQGNDFYSADDVLDPMSGAGLIGMHFCNIDRLIAFDNTMWTGSGRDIWFNDKTTCPSVRLFDNRDANGALLLPYDYINAVNVMQSAGPKFSAYKQTTDQAITSGAFAKVTFGTEEFDDGACFAASRFTPNVAGWYDLNVSVYFAAGGFRVAASIYKNGVEFKRLGNADIATEGVVGGSVLVEANGSTDYFEIFAFQNSGSSQNVSAGQAITHFSGSFVA